MREAIESNESDIEIFIDVYNSVLRTRIKTF